MLFAQHDTAKAVLICLHSTGGFIRNSCLQLPSRAVYGKALVKLGKNCDRIYSLDGDMKNSTYAQDYMKAFPDRFIECFIAEQNMVI